jgi:curli biogenesis system outer membrane secretion channel CsgG
MILRPAYARCVFRRLVAITAAAILAFLPIESRAQGAGDDGVITQMPAEPGVLTGKVPAVKGPKRVVAVARFDAVGSFTAVYGNWDVGGGLEAMLITALMESGRFIVV